MTPAAHTVAAVSTLLSADPGVSTELRTLIVTDAVGPIVRAIAEALGI